MQQPLISSPFRSSNIASGRKEKQKKPFWTMEKLSNLFGKMSRSGSLNPENIAIAEEK